MGRTLGLLSADLAGMMGEQVDDVPDVGNTNSFDSERLKRKSDAYYDDWYGRFYAGTHINTSFDVATSTQTEGKITFTPTLSAPVDATDLYYLSMEWEPEELIRGINNAIEMVEDEALEDVVNETLLVADSVYEYVIPSEFRNLEFVYQESSTADRYSRFSGLVPDAHWRILRTTPRKLWFDPDLANLTVDRNLRLVGQKDPSRLTLDSDVTQVSPAFVLQQAKALLHQSRIRGDGAEFSEHRSQMALAQGMADRERARIAVAPRGWPV